MFSSAAAVALIRRFAVDYISDHSTFLPFTEMFVSFYDDTLTYLSGVFSDVLSPRRATLSGHSYTIL